MCTPWAPASVRPWAPASVRTHPPAVEWGPPQAAVWIAAPPWSSMGCRGTTCITMVFSMGRRGVSAWTPGAPPPLLLLWSWCLQGCFSHFFFLHSSLACVAFCTFLNMLSRGVPPVAEGLSCALRWLCWSRLELAVLGTGQARPFFTEAAPAAPHCERLGICTQYRILGRFCKYVSE